MMENGVQNPPLEFSKNSDNLKKSQYYTLSFKLDSTNNAGLRFSRDPKTVLWAKYVPGPTSPCVDSECHLAEIFVDPATQIQDHAITVINVDRTRNFFAIGFNFLRPGDVDGPTTDYALYDPIGGNQNGGQPFVEYSAVDIGIASFGGAATGAAVANWTTAAAIDTPTLIGAIVGGLVGLGLALILGRVRPTLTNGA